MKKKFRQEVGYLLQVALQDIIQAAAVANSGQPSSKDVAELMAAWGTITKVISHPRAEGTKAYALGQLAMYAGITGADRDENDGVAFDEDM